MEFSHDGNLLATGDKGGRVVIFQRDDSVSSKIVGIINCQTDHCPCSPKSRFQEKETILSTQPSSLTNLNSITLSRWKSKRRLIRSVGWKGRMQLSSFCRPMTRPSNCGKWLRRTGLGMDSVILFRSQVSNQEIQVMLYQHLKHIICRRHHPPFHPMFLILYCILPSDHQDWGFPL